MEVIAHEAGSDEIRSLQGNSFFYDFKSRTSLSRWKEFVSILKYASLFYYMVVHLIYAFERRYSLAFILIQSCADHLAVLDVNNGLRDIVLEGKRMLHPVFVVTLYHTVLS